MMQWALGLHWISIYRELLSMDLMPTVYFKASDLELGIQSNAINSSQALSACAIYYSCPA